MKRFKKYKLILAMFVMASLLASCVDEIKFGNSFLEKAPGGDVTRDTVFNSAEYAKQFLVGIYALQYYGLPYHTNSSFPYAYTGWIGKWENLSDCWHAYWNGQAIYTRYYSGLHNAGHGNRDEKFHYIQMNVWHAVRRGWIFLENVNKVPDLTDAEKAQMSAEAKCLIAARYWDIFRHYGGVPIVRGTFSGSDATYNLPRATAEETVNFIVELLDEAIKVLPWQVNIPANESGRWTKAGAMGLKTSVLLFASSPLFNSDQPYLAGEAASKLNVWYGSYKPEYWQKTLTACEEFFQQLNSNGQFSLVTATGTRPQDYRLAFRKAYFTLTSTEVLHSTRVNTYDSFNGSTYVWHAWQKNNDRVAYSPTQEYIEMFPWADGRPFDWDASVADGSIDTMFIVTKSDPTKDISLTRDPRLYETAIVNGLPKSLNWTTGNMSGNPYETWRTGIDAKKWSNRFGNGYALNKYYLEEDALRQDVHWSYLRLPEVILNYAEALCQNGRLSEAIKQVDLIRARVGMKGLVECNPGLSLETNKDALLNEILRERACELGMEDVRFFDMIRYKMKDRFEAVLHKLVIERADGLEGQWYGTGKPWPTFTYKREEITSPKRVWWDGFDPKWYLSPFPLGEINKGYGLVQNPGW
jgi:hypothetical protein